MHKSTPAVWDLTSYFPAFDGAEYRAFKTDLRQKAADVLRGIAACSALDNVTAPTWAGLFVRWEDTQMRLGHLNSYLECLSAADAANEAFQAESAAVSALEAALLKLRFALARGFEAADAATWDTFTAQAELAGAGHTLRQLRALGTHQMSAVEETLAADLGVDGLHAWGRLYDTVGGKMSWTMSWPGGRAEELSISRRRALMSDPDRATRRAAFIGGNQAWKQAEDTAAAALNAIAGTRLTLYGRRGLADFLTPPMHENAVRAETVHTMFAAIAKHYEVPRRILRAGARLQGTSKLAWYDLEAPRFAGAPRLSWEEGVAWCGNAFAATYPALADYYYQAFDRRWIEAEQRPNKRSGAFCTSTTLKGEERIYMTFNETMADVNTMAHEFGHAWHSHVLAGMRPCAQDYPMTLAETASTFAENMFGHGLLNQPTLSDEQRAFLIDQSTSHAPSYLLNIPVRFHFERRFYEERRAGTVSVSRLKSLMIEAQREVYGDTIEEADDGTDPLFWASKLHFFITDLSFYNFPYTFGYLLSQALYGEYLREGMAFLPRYEEFLRLTGSATCEEAVRQALGRDLGDEAFWVDGIKAIEPRIADLEALTPPK